MAHVTFHREINADRLLVPDTRLDEIVVAHRIKGLHVDRHADKLGFKEASLRARIMKLDIRASFLLNTLSSDMGDLIRKQAVFARSPFDYVLFELCTPEEPERATDPIDWGICGLLVTPRFVWLYRADPDKDFKPLVCNYAYDVTAGRMVLAVPSDRSDPKLIHDLMEDYQAFLMLWHFFCLLLHAPKGVTIHDKPAFSRIVKGKRRAYAAHSLIQIHLTDRQARKVIREGTRGTPRAHEVRGTWVNYHRNPRCDHDWTRLDGDRERYLCQHCQQLRVWRRTHGRGDASIGYVTHEYRVTP